MKKTLTTAATFITILFCVASCSDMTNIYEVRMLDGDSAGTQTSYEFKETHVAGDTVKIGSSKGVIKYVRY